MSSTKQWTILSTIVVLLIGGLYYFSIDRTKPAPNTQVQESDTTITVSYAIADRFLDESYMVDQERSVLSVLYEIEERDPELALVVTEYEGMGSLVESMYDLTNGSEGQYWHFTVNGELPMVGADTLLLEDGDAVSWVFGEFE